MIILLFYFSRISKIRRIMMKTTIDSEIFTDIFSKWLIDIDVFSHMNYSTERIA